MLPVLFANSHLKFAHAEGERFETCVLFADILLDHSCKGQGGGILMAPSESQILCDRHSPWMFFLPQGYRKKTEVRAWSSVTSSQCPSSSNINVLELLCLLAVTSKLNFSSPLEC